jgi:hypothetical protein
LRGDSWRRSAVGWLIAIAGLCSLATLSAAAAEPRDVDYLYIEANEGDSSGGHVALRLGPDTFHFQQESGGLIRMRRDDAEIFAFRYAMLGNRPIHETRIAATDDTFDLLLDTFTRRLLVQAAQFDRLEALQADVELLELWQRRAMTADAALVMPVRAAGLFQIDPCERITASRVSGVGGGRRSRRRHARSGLRRDAQQGAARRAGGMATAGRARAGSGAGARRVSALRFHRIVGPARTARSARRA